MLIRPESRMLPMVNQAVMVTAFSPAYLPSEYTFYSIIFTFVILAVVLAVRPNGLFGRAE